jgi:hypothetical protein
MIRFVNRRYFFISFTTKPPFMKRILLVAVMATLYLHSISQTKMQIIQDSVKVLNSELILQNNSKTVPGFLYNKGNGLTEFRHALTKVSDSLYLVGADSLKLNFAQLNSSVQTLTDAGTITWNVANGNNAIVNLGGAGRTVSISNPVAGQLYRLRVKQDSTGGRTITNWPANTLWPSGAAPVLTSAGNSIDLVTLYYDGTNYYGDYKLFFRSNTNVSILSYNALGQNGKSDHVLTSIPPGALLVVATAYGTSGLNCTVSSSPSLTWTKRVDATAASGSGDAEIYTAVFAAGGSITVTSNWGVNRQSSICYVIINQETTLGGATATGVSQTAPSVSITTTRANSLIICNTSDWWARDGSSRTYRNSPTETQYYFADEGVTSYQYYKQATTISSYTMGLTLPSNQSSGTALLEIRGN